MTAALPWPDDWDAVPPQAPPDPTPKLARTTLSDAAPVTSDYRSDRPAGSAPKKSKNVPHPSHF